MAGIGNYFHGEKGKVLDLYLLPSGDMLFLEMEITGNPHRKYAADYGSDIGIDPSIRVGDRVVYIRADFYGGIWVKEGNEYSRNLEKAFERVCIFRKKYMDRYMDQFHNWEGSKESYEHPHTLIKRLANKSKIPLRFEEENVPSDVSEIEISIFLSYSHKDEEIGQRFASDLKKEAKAEIWFDRWEEKSRDPRTLLDEWLSKAISDCQSFVAILTKHSIGSDWVKKEIQWANEMSIQKKNFHLVFLDMEQVGWPFGETKNGKLIDCYELSKGEIAEELYAAVYGRIGRQQWLKEQQKKSSWLWRIFGWLLR
ncbi:MAG: toll/interleukin-1 receptor domain-containing protein [bacterium]